MSAQLNILEQIEFNPQEAIKQIHETCHNVRRGIFARLEAHKNEIGKMFLELYQKNEELKKEIDYLKELIKGK